MTGDDMANFTRVVIALWLIFGLVMLSLVGRLDSPGAVEVLPKIPALMTRTGVVAAVVWVAGWLILWPFRQDAT